MGALVAARCLLCQAEPCAHFLHVVDPETGKEGDVTLCDTCYWVACLGQDQAVAHLWSSLQEAESAGYTDAGFIHVLWREFRNRSGTVAVGWNKWAITGGQEVEGAFLLAALPNPAMPTLPLIWCRSRMPLFPALLRVALDTMPAYELPQPMTWDKSGRFFLAPLPESPNQPFAYERNPSVVEAVMQVRLKYLGDRDFFSLIANDATPAGFELIRRFLL